MRDRNHVWYQATQASSDIAALALGLANAAEPLVPGAAERLRTHVRAATDPTTTSLILASKLIAELQRWPVDARLVIDDYQLFGSSVVAEHLIETLVTATSIPVLIASRERPSWVTAKKLLYGEVSEFGRTTLAMTHEEASATLSHTHDEMPGLASLAEGWPAVIGLAALLPEPMHPSDNEVPETLHEFFAEELYQGLDKRLQWSLIQLSLGPSIHECVTREVFGEGEGAVLQRGYRCGFLSRGRQGYEMHPLLRQFLRSKISGFEAADVQATAEAMARAYIKCSCWDEAIAVAEEFALNDAVLDVLEAALDAALSEGRVATVQRWVELARVSAPTDLAFGRSARGSR
jgi:ATP/maltotriose-dependent transcriptional regulator MalT